MRSHFGIREGPCLCWIGDLARALLAQKLANQAMCNQTQCLRSIKANQLRKIDTSEARPRGFLLFGFSRITFLAHSPRAVCETCQLAPLVVLGGLKVPGTSKKRGQWSWVWSGHVASRCFSPNCPSVGVVLQKELKFEVPCFNHTLSKFLLRGGFHFSRQCSATIWWVLTGLWDVILVDPRQGRFFLGGASFFGVPLFRNPEDTERKRPTLGGPF